MKIHLGFSFLVSSLLLWLLAFGSGKTHADEAVVLTDQERQCVEQMQRVRQGIFRFNDDHKRLPRFLSDLSPRYCRKADLTCPCTFQVGDPALFRPDLDDRAMRDPTIKIKTYSYEFIGKFWMNTTRTYLEYKSLQREYLSRRGHGDDVPILRCFMHGTNRVLNLTWGGKLKRTGKYWEDDCGPDAHHELRADALMPETTVTLDGNIPPRREGLTPQLLDLTQYYNAVIDKSWYQVPSKQESPFTQLLTNPGFLGGLKYDVRGVIQLKGAYLDGPFPLKSETIQVGQRAQRIHFLLGAYGPTGHGEKIAEIRLNFSDQPPISFPISYGSDTLDWRVDPAPTRFPQIQDKVGWKVERAAGNSKVESIRLYDFQLPNPSPNRVILSIDFGVIVEDSIASESAPALFGITLEP